MFDILSILKLQWLGHCIVKIGIELHLDCLYLNEIAPVFLSVSLNTCFKNHIQTTHCPLPLRTLLIDFEQQNAMIYMIDFHFIPTCSMVNTIISFYFLIQNKQQKQHLVNSLLEGKICSLYKRTDQSIIIYSSSSSFLSSANYNPLLGCILFLQEFDNNIYKSYHWWVHFEYSTS